MKEVKQKEHMKSAKVLDTSQRIPRNAKNISTKVYEQTDSASEKYESASDYAASESSGYATEAGRNVYDGANRNTRRMIDRAKEAKARNEKTDPSEGPSSSAQQNTSAYKGGQKYAEKQAEKTAYERTSEIRARGQYAQQPKTAPQNTVQKIKQVPERTR